MDAGRQPVPPSPGMDRDPFATLEPSIGSLPQECIGGGTSRVITALRGSSEQGKRSTAEKIAAMPVVAISLEDVELISTIRTSLLEADSGSEDNNAIDLQVDLNADAIHGLRTWSTSSSGTVEALEGFRQDGGFAH